MVSKKEDRLDDTVSLIRKAIQACGTDFATINVRAKLISALNECGHIEDKRSRRANVLKQATEEAIAKAKNLHTNWWKQIEENVRKASETKEDAAE